MTVEPTTTGGTPDETWTVRRILQWTTAHLKKHGSETPRLDAEILLAHARGCQRIQLYTRFEEPLTDAERAAMRDLVRRRANHEPVAYLVGHREFYGLDFEVTRDVLIPRPDTETLVMAVIELGRPLPSPEILDIGTGSGCIAITAAVSLPAARVTAVDFSPAALDVTRRNAAKHNVQSRMEFVQGDLFSGCAPDRRWDIVASNPPYIPTGELATLQADVREHEPQTALDGGADGLDIMRRLIAAAPGRLNPGGWLLLEIAPEQAGAVRQLLAETGAFAPADVRKDLAGEARVVLAQRQTA